MVGPARETARYNRAKVFQRKVLPPSIFSTWPVMWGLGPEQNAITSFWPYTIYLIPLPDVVLIIVGLGRLRHDETTKNDGRHEGKKQKHAVPSDLIGMQQALKGQARFIVAWLIASRCWRPRYSSSIIELPGGRNPAGTLPRVTDYRFLQTKDCVGRGLQSEFSGTV